MPLTLSEINRFPVKSCRGHALASATVEPWGLAGDRRWVVIGDDGAAITARERSGLLLVTPALRPGAGLSLSAPDQPDLQVEVPAPGELVTVSIFGSEVAATPASAAANAWFSRVVGGSARLAYLDDPTRRRPDPDRTGPEDSVSFADGYPLLLTTTASLDALNAWIAAGPRAEEGPLPMIRFRPNVVVAGGAAWDEDGWRRVRIGAAVFRAVQGCARCAIPMTDERTGVRTKEPIATLARYRRWAGETWFGMNLVPDTPGARISVGDEVEVVESVPAPDGPPR